MSTETGSGVKRREFLKILGATGATTAVVGCSSEKVGKLIPYVTSPDNTVPGVSQYYATTCRECATACGVLAEVRDGRPIKLEGNPEHPMNRGAICATGLSAVQGLYNPDRYRSPMLREGGTLKPTTWDKAYELLAQKIGEVKSAGTASNVVFLNQHETGTFPGFLDQWLAANNMPAHMSLDSSAPMATIAANQKAYGSAWPGLDFSAAKLVISFGADFLDGWGHNVPQQLDWADARAKLEGAPRLVYIGARRSLTGLNADQWIPAKPGSDMALCAALTGQGTVAAASEASGIAAATIEALSAAIKAAGSGVMALCGVTTVDAVECGVMVADLNKQNGSVGVTIKPAAGHAGYNGLSSYAEFVAASKKMSDGTVPIAFFRGVDVAHTTPKFAGAFADVMAKVPFKVSFSSMPDATSELCDLVLPDNHWLESWGDAVAMQGQLGLQQATLDTVFDTKATADVLIELGKKDQALAARYNVPDYRNWYIQNFPGGSTAFATALTKATISGTPLLSAASKTAATFAAGSATATSGEYFVTVYPSPVLGTGRGANKPWLQELPDPVTKLAWQSWVEVHPSTAKKLGIREGQHLTVKVSNQAITAPAYIYMGVRPDTVAVALGRGHTAYGRFAKDVGINAFDLVPGAWDSAGSLALSGMKGSVTVEADMSQMVTTEGSARQHGRGIGQAMTLAALLGNGGDEEHHHNIPGLPSGEFLPGLKSPVAADAQGEYANPKAAATGMYDPEHSSGMANRRWAMTIDLARCTGCSACVTACYSENNIPTVGASYQGRALSPATWDTRPGANIIKGREMAWIRLERYYEGNVNTENEFSPDFDTRFVPMMCQHCGNAPCEPVCPVYATYHSPDGLNVQVYNRCVGTRYCSNNCPYKVRYFNWFGYGEPERKQYAWPEPMHWGLNPDVTVRGKGVMEKCTFCVQRIRKSEGRAKAEGRVMNADEFTTACAQACPSRAIVFGDAADENWSVSKLAYDRRAYHVFEELNTFTAVVYLKKVSYPAPASPAKA